MVRVKFFVVGYLGMKAEPKFFQILSLSGGGFKGLYTATVLKKIEESLCNNESISDRFDLICGTSIGGILALGLAFGKSPHELKKLLAENGKSIFPKKTNWRKKVTTAYSPIYRQEPLKKLLESVFEEATVRDLKVPVLIPAINITTGKVTTFKNSFHEDYSSRLDIKLVDIALATSAAPTFFPIHEIESNRYTDGGLVANSPILLGIHEATYKLGINPKYVRALSVGTMSSDFTIDAAKNGNGGYLTTWGMGESIIKLTMGSNEIMQTSMAQHILNERLVVIDTSPAGRELAYIDLDNSSKEAVEILTAKGIKSAEDHFSNTVVKSMMNHHADRTILKAGS